MNSMVPSRRCNKYKNEVYLFKVFCFISSISCDLLLGQMPDWLGLASTAISRGMEYLKHCSDWTCLTVILCEYFCRTLWPLHFCPCGLSTSLFVAFLHLAFTGISSSDFMWFHCGLSSTLQSLSLPMRFTGIFSFTFVVSLSLFSSFLFFCFHCYPFYWFHVVSLFRLSVVLLLLLLVWHSYSGSLWSFYLRFLWSLGTTFFYASRHVAVLHIVYSIPAKGFLLAVSFESILAASRT